MIHWPANGNFRAAKSSKMKPRNRVWPEKVLVGEFFGESTYCYGPKTIQLLGYRVVWTAGEFSLNVHADYKWVSLEQLQDFDFAPADINFVKKLQHENI